MDFRHPDRKQIGVQQGRHNLVREPPKALGRQRFFADQAADRLARPSGLVRTTLVLRPAESGCRALKSFIKLASQTFG
jgi:hypothetical protein